MIQANKRTVTEVRGFVYDSAAKIRVGLCGSLRISASSALSGHFNAENAGSRRGRRDPSLDKNVC